MAMFGSQSPIDIDLTCIKKHEDYFELDYVPSVKRWCVIIKGNYYEFEREVKDDISYYYDYFNDFNFKYPHIFVGTGGGLESDYSVNDIMNLLKYADSKNLPIFIYGIFVYVDQTSTNKIPIRPLNVIFPGQNGIFYYDTYKNGDVVLPIRSKFPLSIVDRELYNLIDSVGRQKKYFNALSILGHANIDNERIIGIEQYESIHAKISSLYSGRLVINFDAPPEKLGGYQRIELKEDPNDSFVIKARTEPIELDGYLFKEGFDVELRYPGPAVYIHSPIDRGAYHPHPHLDGGHVCWGDMQKYWKVENYKFTEHLMMIYNFLCQYTERGAYCSVEDAYRYYMGGEEEPQECNRYLTPYCIYECERQGSSSMNDVEDEIMCVCTREKIYNCSDCVNHYRDFCINDCKYHPSKGGESEHWEGQLMGVECSGIYRERSQWNCYGCGINNENGGAGCIFYRAPVSGHSNQYDASVDTNGIG